MNRLDFDLMDPLLFCRDGFCRRCWSVVSPVNFINYRQRHHCFCQNKEAIPLFRSGSREGFLEDLVQTATSDSDSLVSSLLMAFTFFVNNTNLSSTISGLAAW